MNNMQDSNMETDDFEIINTLDVAKLVVADKKPDIARIKAWIAPTDYESPSSEFKRHLQSQAPGTGEWIRETAQFSRWHKSTENGAIWIKAVPGAGKSVVAASMVDSLRRSEDVPVLFFFFRQIIESNRTSRSLLLDWMAQLLPFSEIVQVSLWDYIEKNAEARTIPKEQLWKLLLTAMDSLERVYCIVDALDEMDADPEFLSSLNSLGRFRPDRVKVLMTSRPKQYLQSALKDPSVIHVALEEELVNSDIGLFVRHRVDKFPRDQAVRELVSRTICDRAKGLFLYARLMLDEIREAARNKEIDSDDLLEMVSKLPIGLEEMYNRILRDSSLASNVSEQVQYMILELVTHSARPLRLIEIAAVVEKFGPLIDSNMDSKQLVRSACGPLLEIMEDEVVQILHHSFTEFLLDTSRVKSHGQKTYQFPVIDTAKAHRNIWKACLTYLELNISTPTPEPSERASDDPDSAQDDYRNEDEEIYPDKYFGRDCFVHGDVEMFLKFPFAKYASLYWPYHARKYNSYDTEIFQILNRFCAPHNGYFRTCLVLIFRSGKTTSPVKTYTSLHVAAALGIASWVTYLLQKGVEVDSLDADCHTSLYWAARNGYEVVVKQLLENGAEANQASTRDGLKPMHRAACNNHVKVIELLLAAGVSPTTPKIIEQERRRSDDSLFEDTPIELAVKAGHTECVTVMIPYMSQTELRVYSFTAAERENNQIFKKLLEAISLHFKSIPSTPSDSYSCMECCYQHELSVEQIILVSAIEHLDLRSIKLLLEVAAGRAALGASDGIAQIVSRQNLSLALHKLAGTEARAINMTTKLQETLHVLLEAGADIESRDNIGRTPLLSTICGRTNEVHLLDKVNAFLDAGADVAAINSHGQNILHLACVVDGCLNEELMRLVLSRRPDLFDMKNSGGGTVLHELGNRRDSTFSPSGNSTLISLKLLIKYGAKVNAQDNYGDSFLHLRLKSYMNYDNIKDEINYLVSVGANLNLKNIHGQTAAWNWQPLERKDHFDVLIEAGLDLEAVDNDGATILHHLISSHRVSTINHILKHCKKSLLNIQTHHDGKTVLHVICQSYHQDRIPRTKQLVECGADIHRTDKSGNTLLHELASIFRSTPDDIDLAHYFMDLGIDPGARNGREQTALHIMRRPHSDNRPWNKIPLHGVFESRGYEINIDTRDMDGYTPLHYATALSDHRSFELLSAGANYNAKSKCLRTPLHCAARGRRSDVIAMILHFAKAVGRPVDVNAADIDGNTPLTDACRSGRPESAKLLLDAGASVEDETAAIGKKGFLTACLEFELEDQIWQTQRTRFGTADKRYYDDFRPTSEIHISKSQVNSDRGVIRGIEAITARTNPIAQLLAAKHPNVHSIGSNTWESANSALLLSIKERVTQLESGKENTLQLDEIFDENHVLLPVRNAPSILEYKGNESTEEIGSYLPGMSWSLMRELSMYYGIKFCKNSERKDNNSAWHFLMPITTIVQLGLTELMESLINRTRLFATKNYIEELPEHLKGLVRPLLLLEAACGTSLFNMDMIKLLLNKTSVDMNVYNHSSALHILAKGEFWWHQEAIKFLAKNGANIDVKNDKGETPLMSACAHGRQWDPGYFQPQCCELLLQLGANPSHVNLEGKSILELANNNTETVKLLLRYGADVNVGSVPVLWSAIDLGDVTKVQMYLECGADCNVPRPESDFEKPERYPIVLASNGNGKGSTHHRPSLHLVFPRPGTEADRLKIFSLLLDHGARLDQEITPLYGDRRPQPILHYIFRTGLPERFGPLLERRRFDPNLRDKYGNTVWLAACQWQPSYNEKRQYGPGKLKLPYHLLADSEHYRNEIDFNAVNDDGENMFNLLEKVEAYLQLDWEYTLDESSIKTMIQKKDKRCTSVLHSLLQRRCFIRRRLEYGTTSLCLSLVDDGGANILERGRSRNTVLHWCVKLLSGKGAGDAITLMDKYIQKGGSINDTNDDGDTPLLYFLDMSRTVRFDSSDKFSTFSEYLEFFYKYGADFLAANRGGRTALHIFLESSGLELQFSSLRNVTEEFTQLISYGCDPLKEDSRGLSALDIAAAKGNTGILDLFQRKKKSGD